MIKIKTDNRAVAKCQMLTITEYFKRAPEPPEAVSAMQSDFTNQEKGEVVKQLSEKEESVKKRGKYRT